MIKSPRHSGHVPTVAGPPLASPEDDAPAESSAAGGSSGCQAVLNTVREMGVATLDYLLSRHFMGDIYRAEGIAHLWHLLATRQLDCDMAQSFSPLSEVWVPDYE